MNITTCIWDGKNFVSLDFFLDNNKLDYSKNIFLELEGIIHFKNEYYNILHKQYSFADDIETLWGYILNLVINLKGSNEVMCYYPNFPLIIMLRKIGDNKLLLKIGEDILIEDTKIFIETLIKEATNFYRFVYNISSGELKNTIKKEIETIKDLYSV